MVVGVEVNVLGVVLLQTVEGRDGVNPLLHAAVPDTPLEDGTVTELGELQGQIYITNNSGYGLYYFSQEGADAFASMMNQV
mgnify:CR=1 FL=1